MVQLNSRPRRNSPLPESVGGFTILANATFLLLDYEEYHEGPSSWMAPSTGLRML